MNQIDSFGSNWIKPDQFGSNWFKVNQIDYLVLIGSNWFKLVKIKLGSAKIWGGGLSPTPALSFALSSLIIEKLGFCV